MADDKTRDHLLTIRSKDHIEAKIRALKAAALVTNLSVLCEYLKHKYDHVDTVCVSHSNQVRDGVPGPISYFTGTFSSELPSEIFEGGPAVSFYDMSEEGAYDIAQVDYERLGMVEAINTYILRASDYFEPDWDQQSNYGAMLVINVERHTAILNCTGTSRSNLEYMHTITGMRHHKKSFDGHKLDLVSSL